MCTIYFDLQKAQRDKSKLVYVQRTVTKNGKTFQQGFWVHPSQVKSTDTVLNNQGALNAYQAAQKTAQQQSSVVGNFDKSKYVVLYTTESKAKAMQYAKDNGITWNDHSNPNINWMRCQMAVNKALGGSVTVNTSGSISSSTLDVSNLSSNFDSLSKKDKVVELLKHNSRDSLIAFAKANGISWKESDNSGINWMRASMAIQKHLENHKLIGGTSMSTQQNSQQASQPEPDTITVPTDASPRQKALIDMINKISKKEDFDLFGAVGMIAEDDTARQFMEQKLKPKYEAWKNSHQPSVGSNNSVGYVVGHSDDFGKGILGDTGAILKGLNVRVTQDALSVMYDKLSLASMLYPRELVEYSSLASKDYKDISAKDSQNTTLNLDRMISTLNLAFSVRDTTEMSEFKYDGWDSQVYQKFPIESHGFVKSLEHIKKNNPELASECDRMISVYSDMLKIVDGNPKVLEYILSSSDFSSLRSTIKDNREIVQTELFLNAVCKEHNLSPKEAYNTIYHYDGGHSSESKMTVYDESGHIKTDAAGNYIKINLSDYLNNHRSEYPDLDLKTIRFNTWSLSRSVRKQLMDNKASERYIMNKVMDSLITEKNYCEIQRKVLDMYNVTIKPGSMTTFDVSSNDPDAWDKYRKLYKRDIKDNPESDAVFANLQFISASVGTCSMAQKRNGMYTKPSKANDNGSALSKNFNYYYRDMYNDWNVMNLQEKALSIAEVNDTIQSQLNEIPTFSKKWLEDSRKYVEKHGDETFKAHYYDSDPTTDAQKRHNKAFSVDFGSQSTLAGYMGTPVGDLLTKQITYMAKFCPQMETAKFNTPEKIQKQIENKLGYKPFEFISPQTDSAQSFTSELRRQREELYRKVHCSLKTCDKIQQDAIQTQIKQDWDMGKQTSSGSRLYGHISAVFNGNAYRVNNSLQEQLMLENAKKLRETPQSFFHGTNHSGATGIIGVDGRFRTPKSSSDASKQGLKYAGGMLGSGIYLAKMAGKSAGYFGTWGAGYNTEGCLLMCKAVLGKTYVNSGFNKSAPASYDTVSMQAGTNTGKTILRADEWCVRNPDFVYPEFLVDMGVTHRV